MLFICLKSFREKEIHRFKMIFVTSITYITYTITLYTFFVRFVLLIGKASLTFKSNLEQALSIILKERELYDSKHVTVECR